jgi:hypothetical protein
MKTGREKEGIERAWKREMLSSSKLDRHAFEQQMARYKLGYFV